MSALEKITIKTVRVLTISMVLIMLTIAIIYIYMKNAEIKSNVPNKIRSAYDVQEKKYMRRNVFIIKSKNKNANNMRILYLHGGSYVAETSKEHWDFIYDLVEKTGCTFIIPDYPLTPKYNYKDVFNMMEPLYKEIINKVGKENLILMGDSAGGGMALALAEKISQEQIEEPKHIILLSPWVDTTLENPEITEFEKIDPILDKEALKLAGNLYSGEDGTDNFLVNPINGPLDKLENITIYVGTKEIFNPDIHKLVEKAKQNNINIDLREKQDAVHIWMIQGYKYKQYKDEDTLTEITQKINSLIEN